MWTKSAFALVIGARGQRCCPQLWSIASRSLRPNRLSPALCYNCIFSSPSRGGWSLMCGRIRNTRHMLIVIGIAASYLSCVSLGRPATETHSRSNWIASRSRLRQPALLRRLADRRCLDGAPSVFPATSGSVERGKLTREQEATPPSTPHRRTSHHGCHAMPCPLSHHSRS